MTPYEEDEGVNESNNQAFERVVAARLSRRGFLETGLLATVGLSVNGIGSLLEGVPASAQTAGSSSLLGFTGIAVSTADRVIVPPGYTARVLIAWGDPISDGPVFQHDASNTAADQALQWGMHNDGLVFFPLGPDRGLLAQNNEASDEGLLFPDGIAGWTAAKTEKSLNAQGVSIVEVERQNGVWQVRRPSRYARRITGQTPMAIAGPAAGDDRLKTSDDPTGTSVLGTFANCAMGSTPWGTYLTCEENFNGYFYRTGTPDTRTPLERRYGISPSNSGQRWHTTHSRFNANLNPNEPNRFGWVVEIEPESPASIPVKRTALGRLKHEGARVQVARDERVVVYMGDDERNEYIYRYVSRLPWRMSRAQGIHPLDDGVLSVARFNEDGTGEWLPLTPANPALAAWKIAEILINARAAADAVGATMMDRPEWIDTFPESLTAMATLTNNTRRGTAPASGNGVGGSVVADSARPPVDRMNPRPNNVYGHIIRWRHEKDWTESTFRWDTFVLCGDPGVPGHGSTIRGDKFGSPDGLYVAPSGRLWIQTDVSPSTIEKGDYAGFGNNQMLCADVGTGEVRRFLTGPRQCEIAGVQVTPDERTMFVGVQHPGEPPDGGGSDPANPKAFSSWPDGNAGGRPRSACLVITKDDGGIIGS